MKNAITRLDVPLRQSVPRVAGTGSPLGIIPPSWKVSRLRNVTVKIGSGATPRGGQTVYLDTRHRFALVRSQNVLDRTFDPSSLAYISDEHANQLSGVHLREGDLLLNITGDGVTFGRCCMVPAAVLPACVNQHVAIIRANSQEADPRFLLAYLTHPTVKAYIESFNAGGSRRAITKGHIESFVVPLPRIDEQREIGRVLGAFDEKIQLNSRMNQTLEKMARALFKSWFVDFDPVAAKAAGRKPFGMNSQTAALFPDRFIESQLGQIPKGWAVARLTDVVDINPHRSLRKGQPAPYLDMQSMPTNSAVPSSWVERPFGSGMRFMNGDTLMARITPCLENGKTAYVSFLQDGEIGWGSTEYVVLRSKPPLPLEYTYFLARDEDFRAYAISNMTGSSGRQRVAQSCFSHYPVVVPDQAVAAAFGRVASQALSRVLHNENESGTLAALRDLLLPRLLSGEIRMKQAEEAVMEAT